MRRKLLRRRRARCDAGGESLNAKQARALARQPVLILLQLEREEGVVVERHAVSERRATAAIHQRVCAYGRALHLVTTAASAAVAVATTAVVATLSVRRSTVLLLVLLGATLLLLLLQCLAVAEHVEACSSRVQMLVVVTKRAAMICECGRDVTTMTPPATNALASRNTTCASA
jgi:hypothetical protein